MAEPAPVEVTHETQPAEGAAEAEQVNDFLAERGIELEGQQAETEPSEEPEASEAELGEEDLPPLPEEKVQAEGQEGEEESAEEADQEDEENIPHLAKQLRDSKREQQELESEVGELKQYLNALLATAAEPETAANGRPAQQPAEPEEAPDIFEDPEGAIEHATQPLQQRIQQLEGFIKQMAGQMQQGEAQNRHRQTVGRLRQIEDAYEEENPGYRDRLNRYAQIFVDDMQADGFSEEESVQMLRGNVAAMAKMAAQKGNNPAAFIDRRVKRVLSGERSATKTKDPGVEAAKRAKDDGVDESVASRSRAAPSDELTIDQIREAGIDPHMAGELFEKGGRRSFLRAMREVEEAHK